MDDLSDEVLDILLADQEEINFRRGEIIFKEGVKPQGVYYIRKGKVKKYASGYEGRDFVFYISGEGELIGHHAVISDETNPDTAEALADCLLVFVPRRKFVEALEKSTEFHLKVMRNLSHEYGVFVHFTKILAQYSVRQRTALTLLIVNEKYLSGGSLDATINLSREELASMVGTAKESLVRILKQFKEEGIITTHGQGIVIRDFDALMRVSNYFS